MSSNWSVRVDWAGIAGPETLMDIAQALDEQHASIATEPDRDRTSAQLSVEASTLRQAIDAALAATRAAVHAAGGRFVPVRVDALDEDTFRAEQDRVTVPALAGYAEIAQMAGVSRQRARDLPALPGFPPAVVATSAGPLRVRTAVARWITGWNRIPGRPPTTHAVDPHAHREPA